jgi:membrane-associated progesterone receptor component
MDFVTGVLWLALGMAVYVMIAVLRELVFPRSPVVLRYEPSLVGEITAEELSKHTGEDPYRPILFAVRGQVYDVTDARSFYGPGGAYGVFAGREIARALGKMAITADECSDDLGDFTDNEHGVLKDWETKFQAKYKIVGQVRLGKHQDGGGWGGGGGPASELRCTSTQLLMPRAPAPAYSFLSRKQVVPPRQLTLLQLAAFAGGDPSAPLLLAVRGVVFDVSKGADFYGPGGPYPFAGKECARALAKFSTDLEGAPPAARRCTSRRRRRPCRT